MNKRFEVRHPEKLKNHSIPMAKKAFMDKGKGTIIQRL